MYITISNKITNVLKFWKSLSYDQSVYEIIKPWKNEFDDQTYIINIFIE